MIAASGIANGAQVNLSVDGQYSQVMTAMNTGGTLSTEIVVGQTNLQDVTPADDAVTVIAQQEASQTDRGSGAQPFASVHLIDDTVNVGPGGDNSHVGKYFASADTGMAIALIDNSADLVNLKGGGSSHVGKRFVASTPIEAGLITISSVAA